MLFYKYFKDPWQSGNLATRPAWQPGALANLGNGKCQPPAWYQGNCEGPVDFAGLTPQLKTNLADTNTWLNNHNMTHADYPAYRSYKTYLENGIAVLSTNIAALEKELSDWDHRKLAIELILLELGERSSDPTGPDA